MLLRTFHPNLSNPYDMTPYIYFQNVDERQDERLIASHTLSLRLNKPNARQIFFARLI